MILTSIALMTGFDRKIQSALLETFPSYGTGLTGLEDQDFILKELEKRDETRDIKSLSMEIQSSEGPDVLTRTQGSWINSPPLTLKELRGKVVLVDFWTYSCINCVRTLPYLRAWNEMYGDQGLVILGVHSPEFPFEKDLENLTTAMKELKVTWPVVQDNDFGIWNAFGNRYWPAHYLFDREGRLIQTHFGEGAYEETEQAIQKLLNVQAPLESISIAPTGAQTKDRTQETYLGRARSKNLLPPDTETLAEPYKYPTNLPLHSWGLAGAWKRSPESLCLIHISEPTRPY